MVVANDVVVVAQHASPDSNADIIHVERIVVMSISDIKKFSIAWV